MVGSLISSEQVWEILKEVPDPEVPVLSIVDLGIVRDIKVDNESVEVSITPTYSGCPAMDVIENNIRTVLLNTGFKKIKIKTVISPAWTTDWMSEEGKVKLREYGIAPPEKTSSDKSALFGEKKMIACPQCKSLNTELVSQFGSTACKALYKCRDCREPFDYFKCI